MSEQLAAIGNIRGFIAAGLPGSDARTTRDSAIGEAEFDLPAAASP